MTDNIRKTQEIAEFPLITTQECLNDNILKEDSGENGHNNNDSTENEKPFKNIMEKSFETKTNEVESLNHTISAVTPKNSVDACSDNEMEDLRLVKRSKKANMFDSDSENEDILMNNKNLVPDSENEIEEQHISNKHKRIDFLESDSEQENAEQDSGSNEVLEYKSVDQDVTDERPEIVEHQVRFSLHFSYRVDASRKAGKMNRKKDSKYTDYWNDQK